MPTDVRRTFWKGVLLLLVLFLGAGTVHAQDTTWAATVTYVAGENAYLDVGHDQEVTTGDTLVVQGEEEVRGRLVVVRSSSEQSVVAFAGVPFPLTRGDRLRGTLLRGPSDAEPRPTAEERPPDTTRAERRQPSSQTRADRSAPSQEEQRGPRLSGRLSTRLDASRTSTGQGRGTGETIERRYATPSAALRARVTQLPGDAVLRLAARGRYRYVENASSISPTLAIHTDQLSIEKDLGATSVQAGRFYNRYESYSGYWDGVLVHRGSSTAGVGVAVGFRPERSNERPIGTMPRASGFAHYELEGPGALRYRVNGSYHEVRPTTDIPTHRFAGVTQTLEWGALLIRQDLQVDRAPVEGGWRASRLHVNASVRPLDRLRLRATYRRRAPYYLHDASSPFGVLRSEVGGGASVDLAQATVGGGVTALLPTGPFGAATVYRGRVSVPSVAYGIGVSGHGSVRVGDIRNVVLGTVGLSRRLFGTRWRVRYRFYQTTQRSVTLTTHAGVVGTGVSLPGDYRLTASVRVRRGEMLRSVSIHTGLQMPF